MSLENHNHIRIEALKSQLGLNYNKWTLWNVGCLEECQQKALSLAELVHQGMEKLYRAPTVGRKPSLYVYLLPEESSSNTSIAHIPRIFVA